VAAARSSTYTRLAYSAICRGRREVRIAPDIYYSGIGRGVRNVSLVNIERVAKGLKKSLPELFARV